MIFTAPAPRHAAGAPRRPRPRAAAGTPSGQAGQPAFRADQLAQHYFAGLTRDAAEMTDLPAAGRAEFVDALLPELLTEVRSLACDDGDTRKTLWRAHDGTLIESVLMRYPDRITLCVSSQAGCGMACPFCATGQGGLQRNLSAAEIVEQVRLAARAARDGAMGEPGRLSNVVFMGMGEPLANYKRVLAAVKMITAPAPHGLGHLGTVGDGVDRRPGARDPAADRGETAGAAGGVAAHAGRRTARHPGPGERPLEDRRGARAPPGATPTRPAGGCRSSTR